MILLCSDNNPSSVQKLVLVMFDWKLENLKKIVNFFKFFLYIVEKAVKPDYSLFFSQRSPLLSLVL